MRLKERAEGEDHFRSGVVKSSSSEDGMMELLLLNAEAERDTEQIRALHSTRSRKSSVSSNKGRKLSKKSNTK